LGRKTRDALSNNVLVHMDHSYHVSPSSQQLLKGIEAIKRREKPASYLNELIKLSQTMKVASKCGLGQSIANPFVSIVENFKEEIIF